MRGKDMSYKAIHIAHVSDKCLKEGLTLGLDRNILISCMVRFNDIGYRGGGRKRSP